MTLGVQKQAASQRRIGMLLNSVPLIGMQTRQDAQTKRDTQLAAWMASKAKKVAAKGAKNAKPRAPVALAKPPSTILFNKLAFTEDEEQPRKKALLPKNPKQALEAVQKDRDALAELQALDPKRAAAREEKDSWTKAISKAQGIAVRDDVKLLKRAIARQDKAKERGKKQWEKRQEKVKDEKMAKQKTRKENIESRKEAKKTKGHKKTHK